MYDDDASKKTYDLTKKDVQSYYNLAEESKERARILLSDHFDNVITIGDRDLEKICEVFAIAGAFDTYLRKVFKLEKVADGMIFRVPGDHAATIIKLLFALREARLDLSSGLYTIETH